MTSLGPTPIHAAPKVAIADLGMSFTSPGGAVNEVLRGLNLEVRANEFVSVVGQSGSGKTTLLRCIAGLEQPTTGSVAVDGQRIDGPPPQLALVFQEYGRSLFPWLKVASNVGLPLRSRKGLGRGEIAERVQRALAAVGLDQAGGLYPWQLSGGMQQRVAIARAIAYEPQVLVMDEPFASVDAQTRADLEDLVLRVRREFAMTVLLVTHDVDEAVYMADRVAVVRGKPATVAEVLDIDLPAERDQVATKALPEFIALRSHVLSEIMNRPREAGGPAAIQAPKLMRSAPAMKA